MFIEVIDAVLVERLTFSDTFLVPHKLSRAVLVDELTALGTGYMGLAAPARGPQPSRDCRSAHGRSTADGGRLALVGRPRASNRADQSASPPAR